ncbi:hypothetical protein EVAR_52638_1 [Eumeta japonica]|uniref:Uncharacterized protein n=1 Tax=Eumeta variegata TaxID=151549 RepID=A0A4C1Y1P8_EUMVA|nr:hypothetical protein EVAR_52638_1 [Eumeta japonica]
MSPLCPVAETRPTPGDCGGRGGGGRGRLLGCLFIQKSWRFLDDRVHYGRVTPDELRLFVFFREDASDGTGAISCLVV